MRDRLQALLAELKAAGLTPELEERYARELEGDLEHWYASPQSSPSKLEEETFLPSLSSLYDWQDLGVLQAMSLARHSASARMASLDELLARDKQREVDGFPRKVRVGRLVRPGRGGKDKVVVVPSTVEEKLIHDNSFKEEEEGGAGGSGEGEEGEVIGEPSVRPEEGSGQGDPLHL